MRLFLAIDLPETLRRDLGELQRRLRSSATGWRWVRPEGIHLTVRFLGEVATEVDARNREAWRRAAGACPAVRFGVGGLGVFPPRGGPRVLWMGVEALEPADGLSRLGKAVETAARAEGYAAERRPFHPHLTLARADRRGRPRRPGSDEAGPMGEVEALELVLFESRLGPGGARYTRLDTFPLGRPGSDVP
jgi:2'-5' RNA ligase